MDAETIGWIYFWTAVGSGVAMVVWGMWLLIHSLACREDAEKKLSEQSTLLQACTDDNLRLRKENLRLSKESKKLHQDNDDLRQRLGGKEAISMDRHS